VIASAWRILLLAVLAAGVHPPSEATGSTEEVVVLEERLGNGEQCLVCRKAVRDDPLVELRFKGRTFYVRADMLDEFLRDPPRYFLSLEAHGGLFDEVAVTDVEERAGWGWFYFGLYALAGLVAAAACGTLAVGRARPAWFWFFAGLFFNLLALVALLSSPRGGVAALPVTRAPIACPGCGSEIHPAAKRCSACGAPLVPRVEAETVRV
jgi:hypothetical protein